MSVLFTPKFVTFKFAQCPPQHHCKGGYKRRLTDHQLSLGAEGIGRNLEVQGSGPCAHRKQTIVS
jgi:hypothetical protein